MRFVSWRDRLRPELASVQAYSVPAQSVPVKLDANENPYHLSDEARADLARELARIDLNRYPDPRATRLRETLAESLGVVPEQILVGCGVDEIIGILATAFARAPEGRPQAAVLYPWPSFAMYRITSRAHGLRLVEVPLDDRWQLQTERTMSAIESEDPGVIFFPSPNNPTGNRLDPEVMRAVIESTPGALTVVDEAYFDFCGATLLPLINAHSGLAVFRTLSKMGLAGIRVGALVGHPDLVRELDKARQPYNLNALSQRAAELALTRFKDELAAQARQIIADREKLWGALRELEGVTAFPSDANFILVKLAANASEVWEKLLAQGVLVRNLDGPGPLAGCLRITVGTPSENQRFVEVLSGILGR